MMKLEVDETVGAAYVTVGRAERDGTIAYREDVSTGRFFTRGIDYNADDRIIGYEFLDLRDGVDLSGLPHRDELARLFAAQHIPIREAV